MEGPLWLVFSPSCSLFALWTSCHSFSLENHKSPHLGVPLPEPFELGVGMTEKGEERRLQHPRAGTLLGKQQMLAWQEAL